MFKKNFKKEDIIYEVSRETGFSVNFSKKLINQLIEIIIQKIKEGNLNLKNIGSFKIIKKKERLGRNPKTGEKFKITSRNSISFIQSKKISINLENLNE